VLLRDRGHDRTGRGIDHRHLASQAVALQRKAVSGQPHQSKLRRQLSERLELQLVSHTLVVQRYLGAGVRKGRVGIRRDKQECLGPEPTGADAGDVHEQLVASEAECADDPGR
jgi:hypothetical protein